MVTGEEIARLVLFGSEGLCFGLRGFGDGRLNVSDSLDSGVVAVCG